MHHLAKIALGRAEMRPFRIECSCGTGGNFGSKQEAVDWMAELHFRNLGGINTCGIEDLVPEPVLVEAEDAPAESAPEGSQPDVEEGSA